MRHIFTGIFIAIVLLLGGCKQEIVRDLSGEWPVTRVIDELNFGARTYPTNWEGQYERLGKEKVDSFIKSLETRKSELAGEDSLVLFVASVKLKGWRVTEHSPSDNIVQIEHIVSIAKTITDVLRELHQPEPIVSLLLDNDTSEVIFVSRSRKVVFGPDNIEAAVIRARMNLKDFLTCETMFRKLEK